MGSSGILGNSGREGYPTNPQHPSPKHTERSQFLHTPHRMDDLYGVEGIEQRTVAASRKVQLDFNTTLDPDADPDSPSLGGRSISIPSSPFPDTEGLRPPDSAFTGSQANFPDGSLKNDIDQFIIKLNTFEKDYRKWFDFFDAIGAPLGRGLACAEYMDNNETNTLNVLKKGLPGEDFPRIESYLRSGNKLFKWANHTFPLIFSILKFYVINNIRQQFKKHQEELNNLKIPADFSSSTTNSTEEKIQRIHLLMDRRYRMIRQERKELKEYIGLKTAKVVSKLSTFPLEANLAMTSTDASLLAKCSFGLLRSINGIYDIKRAHEIKSEWVFHLKTKFNLEILTVDESDSEDLSHIRQYQYCATPKAFFEYVLDSATLGEIHYKIKYRNVRLSDDDIKDLERLDACTSLGQAKSKVYTKILSFELGEFLKELDACKTIEDVQAVLKIRNMTTIDLPSTFERWISQTKERRFKRHLIQAYYSSVNKRPLMDEDLIKDLLQKRMDLRQQKVQKATSSMYDQIHACKNEEFPDIKTHFSQLHIHIDQIQLEDDIKEALPFPPQSKDEWVTCIARHEFVEAMAAQCIDYHEGVAQLVQQSIRQAILSKLDVEGKFLNYRWTEYNIGIASAIIQLFFCWQRASLSAAASVLDLFVTELGKLGVPGVGLLYLFYPLYPNVSFKLEALFMLTAEHFFAINYKPNEYSLEGYRLNMQIRLINLISIVSYFVSVFQQMLMWVNIRLIENCIMGLEYVPFEQDQRYIQHNEGYQAAQLQYQKQIKAFLTHIGQLKIKDANLAIAKHSQQGISEDFDPIDNLVESLKDAEYDYFPPEFMQFFQDNLGFVPIKNNQAYLKRRLEDFFSSSETKLTSLYQDNRFAYLR